MGRVFTEFKHCAGWAFWTLKYLAKLATAMGYLVLTLLPLKISLLSLTT